MTIKPFPCKPFSCKPFPWADAIGFGLGVMRLSPKDFWAMTPRELAHAINAVTSAVAPLQRDELDNLMTRYPDGRKHHTTDR